MKYFTFDLHKKAKSFYGRDLWHEGMELKEFESIKNLLFAHYKNGDYYFWTDAKSYVFTLVHGIYTITYRFFRNSYRGHLYKDRFYSESEAEYQIRSGQQSFLKIL